MGAASLEGICKPGAPYSQREASLPQLNTAPPAWACEDGSFMTSRVGLEHKGSAPMFVKRTTQGEQVHWPARLSGTTFASSRQESWPRLDFVGCLRHKQTLTVTVSGLLAPALKEDHSEHARAQFKGL